jgi:hypothetical protein
MTMLIEIVAREVGPIAPAAADVEAIRGQMASHRPEGRRQFMLVSIVNHQPGLQRYVSSSGNKGSEMARTAK